MTDSGQQDRTEARKVALMLLILVLALGMGLLLLVPATLGWVVAHLEPGLGVRPAAGIAFVMTVLVMVLFAVAAGDGLLGELQYMLSGFFGFFVVIWLLLAWIF